MPSKLISIQEVVAQIPDGTKLAVSGNMEMSPMALIREIIRAKRRELYLVCAGAAAVNAELLIGAGVVSTVEFSPLHCLPKRGTRSKLPFTFSDSVIGLFKERKSSLISCNEVKWMCSF